MRFTVCQCATARLLSRARQRTRSSAADLLKDLFPTGEPRSVEAPIDGSQESAVNGATPSRIVLSAGGWIRPDHGHSRHGTSAFGSATYRRSARDRTERLDISPITRIFCLQSLFQILKAFRVKFAVLHTTAYVK